MNAWSRPNKSVCGKSSLIYLPFTFFLDLYISPFWFLLHIELPVDQESYSPPSSHWPIATSIWTNTSLPALCLAMDPAPIRNKSCGFRWHFWRARNSLEILASSCSSRWVAWTDSISFGRGAFANSCSNCCDIPTPQRKRAVGKAQAHGLSERIYHHVGTWLSGVKWKGC